MRLVIVVIIRLLFLNYTRYQRCHSLSMGQAYTVPQNSYRYTVQSCYNSADNCEFVPQFSK